MRFLKLLIYILLYCATFAILISAIILSPHPITRPIFTVLRTIIVCFASVLLVRYTVYMFLAPWCGIMESRERALLDHFVREYEPLVSVMIPAWNEEVGLLSTVKTLLASTYRHMEIVVVNDGSTDSSDEKMRAFLVQYERAMEGVPREKRIEIIYHYKQNGGKGAALNTAISLSHGDILVSIDADCIVEVGAIEAFVQAFRDPRVMAAVGNVKIGNTKTLIGTIQYLEFLFSFYLKKADSVMNTIYIIGGAAGAFRRTVFTRLGAYSITNITEDIQMSMRIQDAGMKIVYVPEARIYTEGASTLQGLLKQRLRWKRGRFQTFWEFRHLFFSRRPEHNKILCWLILPTTLLGEVQLGMEPLFLAVLYIFSLLSHDFSAFISGIIVVSLMFFIQAWDAKDEPQSAYVFLAPIGWLLFYLCSFVEVYSLAMSLWTRVRGQEVRWQRWQRKGVRE